MRKPSEETAATLGLFLSVALLSFLYGFATDHFGLFPEGIMVDAYDQAQAVWDNVQGIPPDSDPVVYWQTGVRSTGPGPAGERPTGPVAISSTWKDLGWKPAIRILDRTGELLHQWRADPTDILEEYRNELARLRDFEPPMARHIYEDGDIIVAVAGALVRLDACGSVNWSLSEPYFHHVGKSASDGTLWHPARRTERVPFPGLEGKQVDHDLIVKVSENGTILEEISVLDLLYENDLQHLMFKMNSRNVSVGGDVTHLNKVEPLPSSLADEYPTFESGDLLVSLRDLHLIFVFDPATRRIKWATTDSLIRQHDPQFIGDGWIGVYDNHWDGTDRGTALGGSRILAFQPHTDSSRVLFPTSQSDTLYTRTAGSFQMLEDHRLLITESRAGRVVEVTERGHTVWDWVNENGKGMVPEVYAAKRLGFTSEQISAWPCSVG